MRETLNFSDLFTSTVSVSTSQDGLGTMNVKKGEDAERALVFQGLRNNLRLQIKREGVLYLSTMKAVIDSGWSHVAGAKKKAEELDSDDAFDSESATPYGYNGLENVLDYFRFCHQAQKQVKFQTDETKQESKEDTESTSQSFTASAEKEREKAAVSDIRSEEQSWNFYSVCVQVCWTHTHTHTHTHTCIHICIIVDIS